MFIIDQERLANGVRMRNQTKSEHNGKLSLCVDMFDPIITSESHLVCLQRPNLYRDQPLFCGRREALIEILVNVPNVDRRSKCWVDV